MPTFTFHRGNAQKLRALPLYVLGLIVTTVLPRTDRIWVFGCGIGPGEGALPLYRLARERVAAGTRLVWLAGSHAEQDEARALGLDTVRKMSWAGFWLTARARVLVVTHGQGDVNRYAAFNGFLVQLWHGIPLKRLHRDSPAALDSRVLGSRQLGAAVIRLAHAVVGRQIRLFPVSSEQVAERVVSAFGVAPGNVVVTGDPRDDVLLSGEPAARRAEARAAMAAVSGPIGASARVVMYAPTWREGDPDPATPTAEQWDAIATWLERVDAVFVVRSHPLGYGDYADGPRRSDRIRLIDAKAIADLTPLLPGVDHLVTDYSSVAYDYALVGGSTVFLAADVISYIATRGMYEPYTAFTGGQDVSGWPGALAVLDDLFAGSPETVGVAEAHRRATVREHFPYLDGSATHRVFQEIVQRTATPLRPATPAEEIVLDPARATDGELSAA